MPCAPLSELQILLLAAGSASRYGAPKQLALLDGSSLVRRAAEAALQTGAALTVVIGAYADAVAHELQGLPLTLLRNDDWAQGMGSSIGCGFRHLLATAPSAQAALLCLADQPRIGVAQLSALIEGHRRAPQQIVAADLGEAPGPPCLFPRRCFEELAQWSGPQGARRLLQREAAQLQRVAMPEAAIDVDTPDDLRRCSNPPGS